MLVLFHLGFDLFVESLVGNILKFFLLKLDLSEIADAEISVLLSEDNAYIAFFALCLVCPFLERGDCLALAYGNGRLVVNSAGLLCFFRELGEIRSCLALCEHLVSACLSLLLVLCGCGCARSIEKSICDVGYHHLIFRDLVICGILLLILACERCVLKDRAVSLLVTVRSEIQLQDRVEGNSCGVCLLLDPLIDLVIDSFLILIAQLDARSLCAVCEDICAVEVILSLLDEILCICLALITVSCGKIEVAFTRCREIAVCRILAELQESQKEIVV